LPGGKSYSTPPGPLGGFWHEKKGRVGKKGSKDKGEERKGKGWWGGKGRRGEVISTVIF